MYHKIYLGFVWHNAHRPILPWQTPWSRVLLEKLTFPQIVKEFSAFYGNRTFIAAYITARHLSISWDRSIQLTPPLPIYWRSILILFHLLLSFENSLFPSGFFTKTLSRFLVYVIHATCPPIEFFITQKIIAEDYKLSRLWLYVFWSLVLLTSLLLGANIFLSTLFSKIVCLFNSDDGIELSETVFFVVFLRARYGRIKQMAWSLTEGFPCFFLSCKTNARVNLAKTGHGPHSPKLLCCSMYRLFCVVLCIVCV